jgi:serine/threonine protein kinase
VTRFLGKGGCATVFLGEIQPLKLLKKHITSDSSKEKDWAPKPPLVAIKQIHLNKSKQEIADIYNEIAVMKQLIHANIVAYYHHFEQKSESLSTVNRSIQDLLILIEFIDCGSLLHMLKKEGNLTEKLVSIYISQALEGLVYLHSLGIIHHDIKSDNCN